MTRGIYTDPTSVALLSQMSSGQNQRRYGGGGGFGRSGDKDAQRGMTERALIEQRGLSQRQAQGGKIALQAQRADAELQRNLNKADNTLQEKIHTNDNLYKHAVLTGDLELKREAMANRMLLEEMRDKLSRFKISALLKVTAVAARGDTQKTEQLVRLLRDLSSDSRRQREQKKQANEAMGKAISYEELSASPIAKLIRDKLEGRVATMDDLEGPAGFQILQRSGVVSSEAVELVKQALAGKDVPNAKLLPALQVVIPAAEKYMEIFKAGHEERKEGETPVRTFGRVRKAYGSGALGDFLAKGAVLPWDYFLNAYEFEKFKVKSPKEQNAILAGKGAYGAGEDAMFKLLMDIRSHVDSHNAKVRTTGGTALPSGREAEVQTQVLDRLMSSIDSGGDPGQALDQILREDGNDPGLAEVGGVGWENARDQLGWRPRNLTAGHSAESQWPDLMGLGGSEEPGFGGGVLPAVDGRIPWGS